MGRILVTLAVVATACGPSSTAQVVTVAPPAVALPAEVSAAPVPTARTPQPTAAPTPEPPALPCRDCWPLSGAPLAGADPGRRPLVVKLDNGPAGRPQYGINSADIVVETLVEGFLTRLAAIYHSREPERFASVRSGRLTDRSLTAMVRGALVYSGSSAFADALFIQDARQGRYVNLSADHLASFFRFPGRPGPYDMYTTPAAMRQEIAKVDPRPVDVPRWGFIAREHSPAAGGMDRATPASQLVIPYREDHSQVTYGYDPTSRTYARSQNVNGQPVRSTDLLEGRPVAAANIVILGSEVREVPEIVDPGGNVSYDTRLTGVGPATVFRDGLRRDGTWSRPNDQAPFVFLTPTGEPILLAPGQTWLHPIPSGWTITSAP